MTQEMKIEKGVKIPPRTRGRAKGSGVYTQTLMKMKSGDSVLVPSASHRNSILHAAAQLQCKVISRKESTGYRVWKA